MKKIATKKYLAIALVGFLALTIFASSSGVAHAQAISAGSTASLSQQAQQAAQTKNPDPSNCQILGANPCTAAINFILLFVSQAMGLLIAVGAWLISIGMALTSTVYSSQATQSGFGVMLSIANLCFVLIIIVIALATILRNETYGYKKALWRLIAMAILVNFGLVITAPIVGFANSMTNYFVTSISGGTNGTNAVVTFTNQLSTKMNVPALSNATPNGKNGTASNISPAGGFFQTLLSLIFIIIFKGLIAMTFLALGILLAVRYIYLVVLLIVLPLAWVTWIFPSFSSQFSTWWKKFIQWTFFPPAALLFVWLALSIQVNFASTVNGGNSAATAIGAATGLASGASTGGTGATDILAQLVNSLVVMAVMIGGLLAASKLADGAGGFAVKQATAVSGAVGRFTAKQGKKGGRALYQKAGGHKFTTALQEGRFGLRRIPLVGRGASLAGRALSNIQTNKSLVEDAKKKVPDNPEEIRKNLRGSMNTEDQLAHIAKLTEKGELRLKDDKGKDEMVNGKTMSAFLNENLDEKSDLAQRFDQVKAGKDANKVLGNDKAMRDAAEKLEKVLKDPTLGRASAEFGRAATELDAATEKFVGKMEKGDAGKLNVNAIFGDNVDSTLSKALAKRFALSGPQLVNGILPKLKAKNLPVFDETYRKVIEDEVDRTRPAADAGDASAIQVIKHLVGMGLDKDKKPFSMDNPADGSVVEKYNRTFARNATGFDGTGGGGGGGGGAPHP